MHFTNTFFAFTFASIHFIPAALSIHPHVLAHRDYRPPSHSIALRQHSEIHPRDLIDICISLDGNVLANAAGLLGLLADVQLCLCLKDLDIILDTNIDIQLLITLLGKARVSSIIRTLINDSSESRRCALPNHAHRTCNNRDPCHYDCDSPFIRSGDKCVCKAPLTMCNNKCGSYPHGCGSAAPRSLKSQARFISNFGEAQAYCGPKRAVCGISTATQVVASGLHSFECVDPKTDLESCGGCLVPHPFHESLALSERQGTNCRALPNILDVTCADYRCIVNKCQDGWMANPGRDECISTRSLVGISLGTSRMKRERRRYVTSVNSTSETTLVVDSDLRTRISIFLGLGAAAARNCPPLPPPSNALNPGSLLVDTRLTDAFITTLVSLSTAGTVSSLVNGINATVDLLASINTSLDGCNCIEHLGLSRFSEEIIDLTTKALDLQAWCNSRSVIQSASGVSLVSDFAIDLGLSTLLDGLPRAGGAIPTKHNPTGPSSQGPSPAQPSSAAPVQKSGISPGLVLPPLLDQSTSVSEILFALATAVIDLKRFSLPSPLFDPNLIGSIIETTANLMACDDISKLVVNIDAVVTVSTRAKTALDSCNCGEEGFTNSLASVVGLAMELKDWSNRNLVAHQSEGSNLPVPNTCACSYHHDFSDILGRLLGTGTEKSLVGEQTGSSLGGPGLGII